MRDVYATDQREFHRKILRMATVIADDLYIWADTNKLWDPEYFEDHIMSANVEVYKRRVHWVRSKIEGELVRRANNVLLPIDLAVVPNLFSCKSIVLLQCLSGTYKAMLSKNKRHLKSRQFIIDNVQTFSTRKVERTIKDCLAEGHISTVVPDETSRTKTLYVCSSAYRRLYIYNVIAIAAVEIAWSMVDSMRGEYDLALSRNRVWWWTEGLNHPRDIIDYAVSEIVVMQSKYID